MVNLKILFLFSVFSLTFISCSSAQDKSVLDLSPNGSKDTNEFKSKEGNFSINISQPLFDTRDLSSEKFRDGTPISGKLFIWRSEKIIYTTMFRAENYSDEDSRKQIFDDMNIGQRKGILRQGGKLASEKDISYGKHRGKEFRYTSVEGVKFIGRNFLIDDMGYQIVGGYADEKDEKEVLEVLNSFRILND